MVDHYHLNVIPGDYGLVSLDIGCTQSILYTRISRAPLNIKLLHDIVSCLLYSAPSVTDEIVNIENFHNISNFLKTLNYNIDLKLSQKECSEVLALKNFISMKLKPAIEFLYWVDLRNVEEFTNPWYMRALPFPFNYSYTKRKKKEAMEMVETLFPLDDDMDVVKLFMINSATYCLSALSTRLGKQNYFFDKSPTTLDIIVYSYVAPLLKLPFPSNDIPNLLPTWPNLIEFVKRIDAKYLPDIKKQVKYLKPKDVGVQSDDGVSYMAVFILALSATSLILSFAYKRGFVKM